MCFLLLRKDLLDFTPERAAFSPRSDGGGWVKPPGCISSLWLNSPTVNFGFPLAGYTAVFFLLLFLLLSVPKCLLRRSGCVILRGYSPSLQ